MNTAGWSAVATLFGTMLIVAMITNLLLQRRDRNETIEKMRPVLGVYQKVLMEIRDIWDHLPAFLKTDEREKELAYIVGLAVGQLSQDHESQYNAGRFDIESPFFLNCFHGSFSLANKLVREIGDSTLSQIWEEHTMLSYIEMLRMLLFRNWQPGFNTRHHYAVEEQT